MAKILSGTQLSKKIYDELEEKINHLKQKNIQPGLAVILVGNKKDSETYVRMKRNMCNKLGIKSYDINLSENITQNDLIGEIEKLNNDDEVHGILIQLPLPNHIDESTILDTVDPTKDVDGFTTSNFSKLVLNNNPEFIPCTPHGCIEILERNNINLMGKNVVVIGRSRIVGMPLSMLCMQKGATVTICHSKTTDPKLYTKNADIIFAACGRQEMVKEDWIKEDAIIIDIGINPVEDNSKKSGYRLVGDVDFNSVKSKASAITPVPGGVGPMTIAMLMKHVVEVCERLNK